MKNYSIILLALISQTSFAKLNVLTTIPDIAVITKEVGGNEVDVSSIAKGTQDPHFIEAKPSYMLKASKADLVIASGLELEIGWLPSILHGSRNPKIHEGGVGYLELGSDLDPLDVPKTKVTRADGDVHPFGNPHFNLDPIRMGKAALIIGKKLAELDPSHAADFNAHAVALQSRLEKKTADWKIRIQKTGIKSIITYHKTLSYFFDRFGLENAAILEPKPGIPPTAGHLLEVIQIAKDKKVKLLMVENFFDSSVVKKIEPEVPGIRAVNVPVLVEGAAGVNSTDDLIETLVKAVEGK